MTWERPDKIADAMARIYPDGYWPAGMDNAAQGRSMYEFERAIYPIWKGIEKKDAEKDAEMTIEQVSREPIMLECLTLHKQDLAIINSQHRPRRIDIDQAKMDNLRKRAVRAAGGRA